MTAGMAEVIAAHYMDRDLYICDCGWVWADHAGDTGSPLIHSAHVVEELAKAGYGDVREARVDTLREATEDMGEMGHFFPIQWLNQRADAMEAPHG